jgi:hypothetical protein
MNALRVIHPYRYEGMWVFDDAKAELLQEPFVSGADTVIDQMVEAIPDKPFPGHQIALEWRREEHDGNWYFSPDLDMEGWLCPALFKYFDAAPAHIYAQFKQKAD